ncbi:unnamed protein product [Staurois parvus]|uniref:NTR domain-containing protein n=1 Tax=Staurois parvus TaxID=386267 RepID=A0ABN9E0C8_9NEOB|nr:unnamed protein product [Staurois parvus]
MSLIREWTNISPSSRSTKMLLTKKFLSSTLTRLHMKGDMCLKFKLHQHFEVGYIQPASVTVYEYYAKENRCTKFYHVEEDSKLLGRICVGDVCRCSEENCFMQQQMAKVDSTVRYTKACDAAVDYVYKTTLSAIKKMDNYVTYVMTIKVVYREGIDTVTVNEKRDFISHNKCQQALNLQIDRDYIVWGIAKDMWLLASKYSYLITKDTWIEMWPTNKECQEKQYEKISAMISPI